MGTSKWTFIGVTAIVGAATVLVVGLLMSINERKREAEKHFFELTELTEQSIDPELWGKNFPRQYDAYKRTVDTARTRYGGSEAFQKLEADPGLRRIFAGYAFGVDYREERGHFFSLSDQDLTERTKKFKQPGACLQCHAGGMAEVYRQAGNGDLMAGFEKICAMPLTEARKLVSHPVACIDCHDPKTMQLRVTRPGFLNGIKAFKASQGTKDYDPNRHATRQEMRSFVCGQCHVEYYFKGEKKTVTYPWQNGLRVEQIESYYDEVGWKDWIHPETGSPVLKAQHPEFELWNQGIHSRSGVACADCHMPYKREGAIKISDHHVKSPLLNVSRACQQCHNYPEKEILDRAETIQKRTRDLMARAEAALLQMMDAIQAAKGRGVSEARLQEALALHRKAQWRLDFINAENSMGFHAPQEAARILAEAIDYARQGQLAAQQLK
jgi:nitrite reductase (cytochrome c-552)